MSIYIVEYSYDGLPIHHDETYVIATSIKNAIDIFKKYYDNRTIVKVELVTDYFITDKKPIA